MNELSIIIVSYNTLELTLRCLETLHADPQLYDAEILVTDNASVDGSAGAIATAFPAVQLIRNPRNVGFGGANNQAIRQATGRWLLLLNSDAFPEPGAVGTLVDYLRSHPEVGAVGPRLVGCNKQLQLSCYRFPGPFRSFCENTLLTAAFPNHELFGDYRAWPHDQERAVDFVIGACLLLRREAIEQCGLFDESFFLYAEETDLCYRLQRAQWKVAFTPRAQVMHLGGESGKPQAARVFCEFHRAQERFVRKHHGFFGLLIYRAMVCVGAALRIAAFTLMLPFRAGRAGERLNQITHWAQILGWTVGFRGPGLAELQSQQQ